MRTKERNITAEFGTDDSFEPVPEAVAPVRGATEIDLDALKTRLLRDRLDRVEQVGADVAVRRAANEAAAMAWLTPYPLFLFPALFDEKARQSLVQFGKQARVFARTGNFSGAV